jgi:1,4-dihydroxy-2-naphthoate octaprenyltransferase
MISWRPWIAACRPKTLVAAIVPVALGGAVFAIYGSSSNLFNQPAFWGTLWRCAGFALGVQVACNFANDLGDSLRGADTPERVGPRRSVAHGEISPSAMGWGIKLACLLALIFGWQVGLTSVALAVAGLLAIMLALAYTLGPYPLAYHGLGDVFVVACFGLQATALTVFALYQKLITVTEVTMPWWPALLAGLGLGLLADNILLANNARDYETDLKAGKRTLVVRWGRGFARQLHAFNVVVGLSSLAWVFGGWPLLLAPLAWWQHRQFRQAQEAKAFIPALAQAAILLLLAGVMCVTASCLHGVVPGKLFGR